MVQKPAGQTPVPKPKPIIKWAGGKKQLLAQFEPLFPRSFRYYHEPFVGSAAVFFHLSSRLAPGTAYLTDSNPELVNLYTVVRDQVKALIESLKAHVNVAEYYYKIRALDPARLSPVERASRFIYLNKTCYNGLYRVNRKGQFNVPFGRYKNPNIVNAPGLRAASRVLQGVSIGEADFSRVLERAQPGDFIYFDPPYWPMSPTASFTDYTSKPFGAAEQQRLAEVFRELAGRGCYVMLSNSDTPFVRELYQEFRQVQVRANRAINSRADRRGAITELVVLSYGIPGGD